MSLERIYYGGRDISFKLPKNWNLISKIEPKKYSSLKNMETSFKKALSNPIGGPGLRELISPDKKVVIICDDATRPTPAYLVLPEILNKIKDAGGKNENIVIMIGKGLHKFPTKEELKTKLGDEILESFDILVHDPEADENLKFLGETSRGTPVWINKEVVKADVKVGIGGIKAHNFAGYSGGPKIILPGVAGRETIVRNHSLALEPGVEICRLKGNPMWEDILEAAKIAGLDLKIDVVLNIKKEIVGIFAGDVEKAQKEGAKLYDEIYKVKVPKRVDVSIVSGYPIDMELLHSMNGVTTSNLITKEGGTIILAAACPRGYGRGWLEPMRQGLDPEEILEKIKRYEFLPTGGLMAIKIQRIIKKKNVVVVTDGLGEKEVRELGLKYARSINEAIDDIAREKEFADVAIQSSATAVPSVG